jgi:hypothetical protein
VSKRQVRFTVLCEDDAHRSFIIGLLGYKGYNPRRVEYRISPGGDAKAWVRKEYSRQALEHRRYRSINPFTLRTLVVMRDGDGDALGDIHRGLDACLASPRLLDENIRVFVPQRAIETWAHHLLHPDADTDEETDYGQRRWGIGPDECRRAGQAFVPFSPGPATMPSLVDGCTERDRIPKG